MAATFKEGDRVQIADREADAEDIKSGLYYTHFRGLTGTVQKVYATGEAAIEIENESLDEPVATRHEDVQAQMKAKWLDGLSEEARNRLTEHEKDFRLRYTILVSTKDLIQPDGKPKSRPTVPSEQASPPQTAAVSASGPDAPRRATSADYDAAEEEYLQHRQKEDA